MMNMQFKKGLLRLAYGTCVLAGSLLIPIGLAADVLSQPEKKQAPSTATQAPSSTKPQAHVWNLQNADIRSVIDEVSKETGKTFIIDPRVNGKVNLIASEPLAPDALYPVFLSILQAYGFAAVQNGTIIKIVPNEDATQVGAAVTHHVSSGDTVTVRVLNVKYVSAMQLVPILRPMLPQWASISAFSPTNSLIMSGTASSLARIARVIHYVDAESNGGADVIRLKNGSATQIATILRALQETEQAHGASSSQASIAADPRTNSLIITGPDEARLKEHVLVSQLDNRHSGAAGGTQVIFLHYLNAKKLAPILDKVAKGESKMGASTKKAAPSPSSVNTNPTPGLFGPPPTVPSTTHDDHSADADIENLTAVLPEPDNNALIITAPSSLMMNLKSIIQEIDIRPAEVFLQAVIVELDASDMEKLGVEWGTFGDNNNNNNSNGTNTNTNLSDGSGNGTSPNSSFQGGAGIAIITNGRFQELIAAIKGTSSANILSQPTIMVLDNKKALLSVGKQVSIQTSQSGAGQGGASPDGVPFTTSTFAQQDVGLKLAVTPQVDEDNTVQLLIDQENGSLQNPDNPGTTPVINKSSIKTTVMVNSGDTLVIGGLTSNSMTLATYKTPILSDIPIIGRIFTYKQHELQKQDLMVFLRPVIIKSPLVGTRISTQKYNDIRNLQVQWSKRPFNNPDARVLPPNGRHLILPVPFTDD